jgi:hypothetical protein
MICPREAGIAAWGVIPAVQPAAWHDCSPKTNPFDLAIPLTVLPKLTINVVAAVFGAAWRD